MAAVDLASMANQEDKHQYFFILNVADETVCSDSVFPTVG